jgi:hypothetical protein
MKDIFKILQEAENFSKDFGNDFEKEIMKNPQEFVQKIIASNPELAALGKQLEELSKELDEQSKNKNFKQANNIFDNLKKNDNVSNEEKGLHQKLGERAINKELEKQEFCFVNDENCNHIIDSHSIQENGELSLIAKNRKVIAFQRKEGSNDKKAVLIPISQASTFRGFCQYHDQIFEPLDKDQIDSEDLRNFLYSFRTFAYSYFGKKAQNNYMLSHVNNAKLMIDKIAPNLGTLSDLIGMNLSQSIAQLRIPEINREQKQLLDEIHFEEERKKIIELQYSKSFDGLNYFVIELDHISPVVFAAVIEFEQSTTGQIVLNLNASNSHNCVPLMLTIVPIESKTRIILSCFKSDTYATNLLDWFELGNSRNEASILNFITKLILHNSKNLYLSPMYWDSLSSDFREKLFSFVNNNEACDIDRFNFFEKNKFRLKPYI